ncbi:MAG: AAA domain-containing protein [Bacillota bacterium]
MTYAICLIFTDTAARRMLELKSRPQETYSTQQRDKAYEVLWEFVEVGNPVQCIVQKARQDGHFEICIPSAKLVLRGAVEHDPKKFIIISVRSMDKRDAEAPWNKTVTLQFYDERTIPSFVKGVDQSFWDEINALGSGKEFAARMTQQMEDWMHYLTILERLAEQKQFSFQYDAFRSDLDWTEVEFKITKNESISGNQVKKLVNEKLHLEVSPNQPLPLGTLIDYKNQTLYIELEDSVRRKILEGTFQIPESAFLVYKNRGTLTEIKRQRNAIDELITGRSRNKNLASLLFDLDEYFKDFISWQINTDDYDFINPNLDPYQKQAVVGALEAKDFYLIKGPPGTGKTTVIAEICAQAARQGKKILVASQTNVAVDNVLEKFVGVPNIRAIRFKNDQDYDEETDLFSPQNAVGQWLDRILAHSKKRWEEYESAPSLLKEIDHIFNTAKLYAAVQERLSAFQAELSGVSQQLENNRLLIQENQGNLNYLNEMLRTADLLSTALSDRDLARFFSLFRTWNDRELFQNRSATAFAEKMKLTITQMSKFFALGSHSLDSPYEVIQSALSSYLWYKEQRQEVSFVISHLESAVQKLTFFPDVHKDYQVAQADLRERQNKYDRELAAYRANSEKIEKTQSILLQLENLDTDPSHFQRWASWFAGSTNRLEHRAASQKLAIEKAPVLSNATGEAKTRLADLTERRINNLIDSCLDYMEDRRNLQRALDEVRQIISSFEAADRELRAKVPNPGFLSQTDSERLLRSKTKVNVINPSYPDARALANIKAELQQTIDGYLGKGLVGVVGSVWRTVSFGLSSLFDGQSMATKKEAFLKEGLMLCHGGKTFFSRLKAQWEEKEMQSKENLDRSTEQLASGSAVIVKETVERLIFEYREKISGFRVQQENQERVIQQLKDECLQLEQKSEVILGTLDSIYAAGIAPLRAVGVWGTYPSLKKLVDALLQTSDYSQREKIYYELKQELQVFLDLVQELDSLDLSSELHPVIASAVREIESLIQDCEDAFRTLKARGEELKQTKAKLDEECQVIMKESADYAEKWEALRQKLHEISQIDLPQAEDVHSVSYLQKLQKLYPAITKERKQMAEKAERAGSFAAEWHMALTEASRYEKEQLRSLYLKHCNLIGSTCSQTARSEFKEFGELDYVIVDEVSKATPPELLMPLLHGKTLILVGDDKQLPPMIGDEAITELAEELGCSKKELDYLKRSLFAELWGKAPDGMKTMLLRQYRMHSSIMQVINQFYEDKLEQGYESLDEDRRHNCGGELFTNDCHAVWIDVPIYRDYAEEKVGNSYINTTEIKIIEKVLEELNNCWGALPDQEKDRKKVGVITFYAAQERRIRQQIDLGSFPNLQIEIGTVDRFQGREYPIVVVSMVRNNTDGNVGHAKVPERVNVALSRAQELLILIGCGNLFRQKAGLQTTQIYDRVSQVIGSQGGMKDVHRILMDR